jgi:hypothetical protein
MSQISITVTVELQDLITEELLTVKEKDVVNDSKLQIVSKMLMKEEIGRSPDLSDCISLRMWWIIKNHHIGQEDKGDIEVAEENIENFLDILLEDQEEILDLEPDIRVYD